MSTTSAHRRRGDVAYIPEGRVVGLNKLNHVVDTTPNDPKCRSVCPDSLTALQNILGTQNVAVVMDAKHLCVSSRGIQDEAARP